MRRLLVPVLCLAGLAGCDASPPPQVVNDGFLHIQHGGTSPCGPGPISLDGSHEDIVLSAASGMPCRMVRVAGAHNDVTIDIAPGGQIDITGEHNDVTWRQTAPGPRPLLRAIAPHNDFHRDSIDQ